ncbi:MAG: TonB-dependent receptor [Acidimicrobiia bacterium]|nr:TonB-dependent receptor [Acidimicrobiia bacterium]
MLLRVFLAVALALLAASQPSFAQGNPTGGIQGRVTDPEGLPVPGVTVTAESPALQGMRTAVSNESGDYILPFLPPGAYTVAYEIGGFQPQRRAGLTVVIAETLRVDVRLALSGVQETVEVLGTASTEIAPNLTVATTYKSESLELLPVGRTLNAAVLLAPGVTDNGPNDNIMVSGAMSYENLFLINGVVVNENLRAQARPLFIEDAIQETKISTGGISAEYGRFQGGVVNMITKSGSNQYSGSLRVSFINDAWSARTPYPGDENIDRTVPTYELTAGGPVLRDRIWFFGAGRFEKNEDSRTADYTGFNYTRADDEKRYEGKVTWALTQGQTFKGAYTRRRIDTTNNNFGTIMDARSLYDNANQDLLYSANYTGVLTSSWFVEGQYSKREYSIIGTGATVTDFANGTPIWDRSRGQARFNSPTFCRVCGSGLEIRNNQNMFAKANYFLSTDATGSHNVVAGVDVYEETRRNDNYQSGSQYRVQATRTIIQGLNIYPVFASDNTTFVEHLPLVGRSVGNDLRTTSVFANDTWRFNPALTFSLGVRYDANRSKDQAGTPVVSDSAWSPRVGATWNATRDAAWVANLGFARYVTGVNTALVDAGSAGGRTATFSYFYQGPAINTNAAGPLLTAEQALPILFDWFFASGGTNRATRNAPSIPGVTTKVDSGLKAPNSNEWMAGVARQLGGRGMARVDYLYRSYADFYGDFRDPGTGKVTDPTGRVYDLTVVRNTNLANRTYKGVHAQAAYRVRSDLTVSANYTLSWQHGNFTGEDDGSGPIRFLGSDQPEYRQESWNFPTGYNPGDQRHKVRAWTQYRLPLPDAAGGFDVGIMQRWDSSDASSADGTIDPRNFVANPGYISTPSTVAYYFGPRGAQRYADVWRTDLSLVWGLPIDGLGRTEVFFRGVVTNLLNRSAQVAGNETILTRTNDARYQLFNPFTTTPVQGAHWEFGPEYMRPTGTSDYQSPREFSFSLGVRF